jgi:hypothetical protein
MARAAVLAAGLELGADAIGRGARPGWRATWTFTLLLAITTAFTPITWLIALVLAVAVVVLRLVRGQGQLFVPQVLRSLAVLGTPIVVLAPWSLGLLAHPSRFLAEAGLPFGARAASASGLVLLSPGGPRAAGGVLFAGLVLAALAALLRAERRLAILTAWAGALIGLIFAVVENGSAWAGPATLLYGLALLAAATVGAEGAKERIAASGFGWRQPVAALIVFAAAAAPLIAAFGWMAGGADGPVERRDPTQVPAFVAEESSTADQARTLVLGGTATHVSYALVRGAGVQLGDAELAAAAGDDTRLGGIVANLVAGSGADQAGQLGGYAVRYVLVQKGSPRARADGEEGDSEGHAQREVQCADMPERPDVDDLADREDHKACDERDRGDHRKREEQRHRTFGSPGGLLVDVLAAGLMGRQARVGERVLRDLALVSLLQLTWQSFF